MEERRPSNRAGALYCRRVRAIVEPYLFRTDMVLAILLLYYSIPGFFWPHSQELMGELHRELEGMTSYIAIKWVVWAILNILHYAFFHALLFVVFWYIDLFIMMAIPLFHRLFSKYFPTRRVVSVEIVDPRICTPFNYSINS